MIRWILFLFAGFILSSSGAFAKSVPYYEVIKDKSSLKFIAIQNNVPIEGEFKEFAAIIQFDPDNVEQSRITVEVNIASVTAAYDEVSANLKLPEWLSAVKFPKAFFVSKKITRMPMSDNYIVEGELSIRDKKVPVTLNFQMTHFDKENAVAKGSTTLRRRDFDIGQGKWEKDDVVKNEVRVEFRIAATVKK
jgi:polyisoprenoid-binding protein YceI